MNIMKRKLILLFLCAFLCAINADQAHAQLARTLSKVLKSTSGKIAAGAAGATILHNLSEKDEDSPKATQNTQQRIRCNQCNGYGRVQNYYGQVFNCPKCNGKGYTVVAKQVSFTGRTGPCHHKGCNCTEWRIGNGGGWCRCGHDLTEHY